MHEDLAIVIEPDGSGGLGVRLLQSPGGARTRFALPWTEAERGRSVGPVRDPRHCHAISAPPSETASSPSPEEIGLRLFSSLTVGEVARPLIGALERVRGEERGHLRLRLVLDPSSPAIAEVAALPWELLFDPSRGFLARSLSVSVVRFVAVPGRQTLLRSSHLPLRVLLAVAHPRDLERLDLDQEQRGIREALGRLPAKQVRVETADARDPMELFHRLRRGGFHVLHYLGHGDFDRRTGEGCLLFGGPEDAARPVSGPDLASALEDLPELRLVVLNACDTGRSGRRDGLDPYSGVAQALVRGGIPAVVAMQAPISDRAAIAFAEALYQGLADNEPVDLAVAHGRRAIRLQQEEAGSIEWAAPALFLQVADGRLLDLRPPPRRRLEDLLLGLAGILLVLALWGIWEGLDPGPPYRTWLNPAQCPSPVALGGGAGMRFGLVPAGSFAMGSERGDEDERPVHRVEIPKAFCLGTFEVTWRQWWQGMGDEPDPGIDPEQPAGRVSFEEAQRFVATLNQREGEERFRLPAEAEWEYAARAGTTTEYSFGDDEALLPVYGNCLSGIERSDNADRPVRVGSYRPNPWGFSDMSGNVWEWVDGPYAPYGNTGLDLDRPQRAGDRVRRGGSFTNRAALCRSAERNPHDPESQRADTGLRIVRTID